MRPAPKVVLAVLTALCLAVPSRAQINEYAYPDMYLQYVPAVADLGLGLAGVRSEHVFWDRVIAGGIGFASEIILVNSVKALVHEMRPDGSSPNSFPSGHTATAFLGAELVRHEYGWGWGAGAYAVATTVAVMRNYNNWHWLSDCLAGAGLGILTAHVGQWLLEPTKRLLHIPTIAWDGVKRPAQVVLAPTVDPYSGVVCTTLAINF